MAEKIWPDRCEDCYNRKPLTKYSGPLVSTGREHEFCQECLSARAEEHALGKEMRHVGIPADVLGTSWVELPEFTAECGGHQPLQIEAKYRRPDDLSRAEELGGEIRFRIKSGNPLPLWLPGGVLFLATPAVLRNISGYALSSAKHMARIALPSWTIL